MAFKFNPFTGNLDITGTSTGGSGTVTSVSVTTANGVSGSVADATTTPAISLTLGAITPSSVAAVGTVTGSNLSGTNTGDVTVTDSSEIDFTLAGQNITAAIVAGSIDETKLDASTNASLDLADSALQAAAIGVTVQAYSAVLAATTASFLIADETKLDGIAAGAEVNVNADWNSVSGDSQILNKPTISGSNTGDQTSIVGITGTMAQFNTAVTDGNILFNDEQGLGFRFENRTSDPGTPTVGQVWLRTDL